MSNASPHPENSPRRLLVLGAGTDQCFMLRTAREMGIETLAVDVDPNAPGFRLADASIAISNRDVSGILAALRERGEVLHGVSTMGSDIPHIVAEIAIALGLPSIPMEAATRAVDKFRMKECFSEADILVPDYALLRSSKRLASLLADWGRLVLKPLDQAGSKGVFLVSDLKAAEAAFLRAQGYSASGDVLAERYLPGDQISSESLVIDGGIMTPGLADRNYDELERFVPQILENGGWVPSRYLPSIAEIDRVIERCARALGIENGVVKGDLVRTADGRFAVIEVAARLSGGGFCESLVPLGTGVNYVKQVIRQAVGLPVERGALRPVRNRPVANRYFFPEPGRLTRIDGVDQIRSKPWLRKLEFWYQPGDVIPPIAGHGQRGGVFIVQGKEKQELSRYIEEVYETIEFVVETHASPSPSPRGEGTGKGKDKGEQTRGRHLWNNA